MTYGRTDLLGNNSQGYTQGQKHGNSNDTKTTQDCPDNRPRNEQITYKNNKFPKPAQKPASARVTRSSGVSKATKKRPSTSLRQTNESSHSSRLFRKREGKAGNREPQRQLSAFGTYEQTLRRSERLARKYAGGHAAADHGLVGSGAT